MRISDWSSDVCSSDLHRCRAARRGRRLARGAARHLAGPYRPPRRLRRIAKPSGGTIMSKSELTIARHIAAPPSAVWDAWSDPAKLAQWWIPAPIICRVDQLDLRPGGGFVTRMREEGAADFQPHVDGCFRSEEHTSEL